MKIKSVTLTVSYICSNPAINEIKIKGIDMKIIITMSTKDDISSTYKVNIIIS